MAIRINGTTVVDDSAIATINTLSSIVATSNSGITVQARFQALGEISGYTAGGWEGSNPITASRTSTVSKFSFASDANATSVGSITVSRNRTTGQSSSVSGYTSGGNAPTAVNVIDKFPFASDGSSTDVGDLTVARSSGSGTSSPVSGYTAGGSNPGGNSNVIDKFPFAADGNATDVGDLTSATSQLAGQSSTTFGYASGENNIQKYSFASDANATSVGSLSSTRSNAVGQSSTVSGYTSGGLSPAGPGVTTNVIDKFPFATDANATDVGDLTQTRTGPAGQSSTVSGYTSGGYVSSPYTLYNNIDKFPFATNANATDVGDLPLPTGEKPAGTQV